jgi:hypothetical protein
MVLGSEVQGSEVQGSGFRVQRFRVQPRRRPKKWPVKSKKKLIEGKREAVATLSPLSQ